MAWIGLDWTSDWIGHWIERSGSDRTKEEAWKWLGLLNYGYSKSDRYYWLFEERAVLVDLCSFTLSRSSKTH